MMPKEMLAEDEPAGNLSCQRDGLRWTDCAVMKLTFLRGTFRILLLCLLLVWMSGCSSHPGESLAATLDSWTNRIKGRGDGKSELDAAFAAKKSAQSWRMQTAVAMHPGSVMLTTIEVACPNRQRIVTTVGDTTLEAVRIGGDFYTKDQEGHWTKSQNPHPEWSPCGDAPGDPAPWALVNEGREMTTVLDSIAGKGTITRGGTLQLADGPCQQWTLSMEHPGGGHGLTYNFCISGKDHLMRSVDVGRLKVTYSDWNAPLKIEAPM